MDIIKKLNRYTKLVESNLWDNEEALQLKSDLYSWGGSSESELLRLETEVKLREFDRENEES